MTISDSELLQKLKLWCDRQERCHSELRTKLFKEQVWGEEAEAYIAELISLNYLSESRFAEAYVSGKFRIKKWGRNKIVQQLKSKRVPDSCIKIGLKEIDDTEYLNTLNQLIDKKIIDYNSNKNPFSLKGKIAKYAMTRGFEGDLVWSILNEKIKTFN